jgi:quercetin 2,3-dioxygenase
MYAGLFDGDESTIHTLASGRMAYVHIARGSVRVNGVELNTGDAVKIENESTITIDQGDEAEVLLFDLGQLQ